MYTQTNRYRGRECTYIYRLRRRKGHGNSSYPEVSREREISRDFVIILANWGKYEVMCHWRNWSTFMPPVNIVCDWGHKLCFRVVRPPVRAPVRRLEHSNSGKKDSILATESIFSIRFASLINLPLLHWYRYSNSNDGEFGEGPGGVSTLWFIPCHISIN